MDELFHLELDDEMENSSGVWHEVYGTLRQKTNPTLRSLISVICKVQWMYNIRGYHDKGKVIVNFGCYFPCHLLGSSYIKYEGWRWGKGLGFSMYL